MNYNFNKKKIKKKAIFRLFICYKKNSSYFKKVGPQKTYRGYFKKGDKGRGKLMNIFLERINDIRFAMLYNDENNIKKTLIGNEQNKTKFKIKKN